MRLLGRAGHTGHLATTKHPNGSIYLIFGENPRSGKRKVYVVCITSNDTFSLVKEYRQDRDFSNHVAHAALEVLPAGDIKVFLAITQLDTDGVERAFPWMDTIPNAAPPYTPAETYQYMPSAVDLTARERATGAYDKAEQTVGEIKLVRGQMREYENEIEAKIVRHVASKFGDIMGKVDAKIKALRDEVWSKLIPDKIFAELSNSSAPLPNKIKEFIKQVIKG